MIPMRAILIALALFLAAIGGYAFKEFAVARNAAEVPTSIDQQISQYLKNHPEEVMTALRLAQAKEERRKKDEAQQALDVQQDQIFNNPADPVLGNLQGDVTVVEFFDYRCPYCKRVADSLMQLLKDDPNIKLVFKEFPILGPESVVAAKVALAAHRQGKYEQVHTAFMSHKGSFDQATLLDLAASVGADRARLATDMQDPAILGLLQANESLAAALDITGTPGFLFGKQLVPGAVSLDDMKELVSAARAQAG
ncbi:DsbA family protein [Dongia deserti]|uniref:DsbA family protein n=1 Tax=Dongia deserti TaxID=2268030 RepID=UPI00254979E7|nr:DsbA family protein [Dongia deserti]